MKLYKLYDDSVDTNIQALDFAILLNKCSDARNRAESARREQLELEQQILALPQVSPYLKARGTTSFADGALKIMTKVNQKWDQQILAGILADNELPMMPFDIEYKPNAARLKLLKENFPNSYKLLLEALTETEAKPYFTFGEAK